MALSGAGTGIGIVTWGLEGEGVAPVSPGKPVLTAVVAGSLKIRLTWTKPDNTEYYSITKDGDEIATGIDVDTLFYLDTVLVPGDYTYIVIAHNEFAETPSDPVTITAVVAAGVILASEIGNLSVDILCDGVTASLEFKDAAQTISIPLSLTAAQLAGTEWFTVKITREGTSLVFVIDKDQIHSQIVTLVSYSGDLYIMEGKEGNIFDIRVLDKAVPKSASDYYIDDIDENGVNSMIPRY